MQQEDEILARRLVRVKPRDLYFDDGYSYYPNYNDESYVGNYDDNYKHPIYGDESYEDHHGEVTVQSIHDHGLDQRLDFSNDVVDGQIYDEYHD